ncbi:MAG: hypothetical protein ACO1SV_23685 [Fimbriimonas sp.]
MRRAPRIAKPCSARWSHMRGDERVRHCTHCDRKVFNLSEMSEVEATALLREHEGRVCVRFFQRADGTLMTRDCGVAERAIVKTKAVVVGFLTALGIVIFPITSASATTGVRMSPRTEMKIHLRKVQQLTADLKAEKDPEVREFLLETRKKESDLAKAAARRLMEEEG